MTSYGQYQDAVLNKINDLANPQTNNAVISATTDILDATVPPTPLLCDGQGHLQVDILSGGGHPSGDASADNQTNGNQKTQILGNTLANGSGDSHHIHVDASGNVRTSIVSSVNTLPANSTNSAITDSPSNSFAVSIRGRTDPALASTEKALKVASDGKLEVSIPATTGIKLEDISSSLDADHVSNSRSIITTLKGRTNIADHTSGTFLKVTSDGFLEAKLRDIEAGIVNSLNVASKHDNAYLEIMTGGSVTSGNNIKTNAHVLSAGAGVTGGKQPITIYVHFGAGTSDSNFTIEVQKSYDNTIYFVESNFTFSPVGSDVDGNVVPAVVGNGFSDGRSIKVKITNNSESNPTSVDVIVIERQ